MKSDKSFIVFTPDSDQELEADDDAIRPVIKRSLLSPLPHFPIAGHSEKEVDQPVVVARPPFNRRRVSAVRDFPIGVHPKKVVDDRPRPAFKRRRVSAVSFPIIAGRQFLTYYKDLDGHNFEEEDEEPSEHRPKSSSSEVEEDPSEDEPPSQVKPDPSEYIPLSPTVYSTEYSEDKDLSEYIPSLSPRIAYTPGLEEKKKVAEYLLEESVGSCSWGLVESAGVGFKGEEEEEVTSGPRSGRLM